MTKGTIKVEIIGDITSLNKAINEAKAKITELNNAIALGNQALIHAQERQAAGVRDQGNIALASKKAKQEYERATESASAKLEDVEQRREELKLQAWIESSKLVESVANRTITKLTNGVNKLKSDTEILSKKVAEEDAKLRKFGPSTQQHPYIKANYEDYLKQLTDKTTKLKQAENELAKLVKSKSDGSLNISYVDKYFTAPEKKRIDKLISSDFNKSEIAKLDSEATKLQSVIDKAQSQLDNTIRNTLDNNVKVAEAGLARLNGLLQNTQDNLAKMQAKAPQLQAEADARARTKAFEVLKINPNAGKIQEMQDAYETLKRIGSVSLKDLAQGHYNLQAAIIKDRAETSLLAIAYRDLQAQLPGIIASFTMFRKLLKDSGYIEEATKDLDKIAKLRDKAGGESQLKYLEDSLLKMTRSSVLAYKDMTTIAEGAAKLGLPLTQYAEYVDIVAKASSAFAMSSEDASRGLGKILNIFKVNLTELRDITDAINSLADTTPTVLESSLITATSLSSSTAKALGVSLKEHAAIVTVISSFENQVRVIANAADKLYSQMSIAPSGGGTPEFNEGLRRLGVWKSLPELAQGLKTNPFNEIIKLLKAVKELNTEQKQNILETLFGKDYLSTMTGLVDNLDLIIAKKRMLDEGGYKGNVKDVAFKDTITLWGKTSILLNNITAALGAIGDTIAPIVKILIDMGSIFFNIVESIAKGIPAITGFITATLGLAMLKGTLQTIANLFNLAFPAGIVGATAKVLGIEKAVALLILAFNMLKMGVISTLTSVGVYLSGLLTYIPYVGTAITALGAAFTAVQTRIITGVAAIRTALGLSTGGLWWIIAGLTAAVVDLWSSFGGSNKAVDALDEIIDRAEKARSGVSGIAQATTDKELEYALAEAQRKTNAAKVEQEAAQQALTDAQSRKQASPIPSLVSTASEEKLNKEAIEKVEKSSQQVERIQSLLANKVRDTAELEDIKKQILELKVMRDKSEPERKKSIQYMDMVIEKSIAEKVDPAVMLAIATRESGWDAKAKSPKGATGLMQIMPKNVKAYKHTMEEAVNPVISTEMGIKVLKEQLAYFNNNIVLAIAGYNAGQIKIQELVDSAKKRNLPPEDYYKVDTNSERIGYRHVSEAVITGNYSNVRADDKVPIGQIAKRKLEPEAVTGIIQPNVKLEVELLKAKNRLELAKKDFALSPIDRFNDTKESLESIALYEREIAKDAIAQAQKQIDILDKQIQFNPTNTEAKKQKEQYIKALNEYKIKLESVDLDLLTGIQNAQVSLAEQLTEQVNLIAQITDKTNIPAVMKVAEDKFRQKIEYNKGDVRGIPQEAIDKAAVSSGIKAGRDALKEIIHAYEQSITQLEERTTTELMNANGDSQEIDAAKQKFFERMESIKNVFINQNKDNTQALLDAVQGNNVSQDLKTSVETLINDLNTKINSSERILTSKFYTIKNTALANRQRYNEFIEKYNSLFSTSLKDQIDIAGNLAENEFDILSGNRGINLSAEQILKDKNKITITARIEKGLEVLRGVSRDFSSFVDEEITHASNLIKQGRFTDSDKGKVTSLYASLKQIYTDKYSPGIEYLQQLIPMGGNASENQVKLSNITGGIENILDPKNIASKLEPAYKSFVEETTRLATMATKITTGADTSVQIAMDAARKNASVYVNANASNLDKLNISQTQREQYINRQEAIAGINTIEDKYKEFTTIVNTAKDAEDLLYETGQKSRADSAKSYANFYAKSAEELLKTQDINFNTLKEFTQEKGLTKESADLERLRQRLESVNYRAIEIQVKALSEAYKDYTDAVQLAQTEQDSFVAGGKNERLATEDLRNKINQLNLSFVELNQTSIRALEGITTKYPELKPIVQDIVNAFWKKGFNVGNSNPQLPDIVPRLKVSPRMLGYENADTMWESATNGVLDFATTARNNLQSVYQVGQEAFSKLEDVVLGFVKTGKLNFEDFTNSVLEGLTRIAIQKAFTEPMAQGVGEGMAWLGSIFKNGGGGNETPFHVGEANLSSSLFDMFPGAVPHAKGGVLTHPTIALMGEKGAEAVLPLINGRGVKDIASGSALPLVRDAQGNLGVDTSSVSQISSYVPLLSSILESNNIGYPKEQMVKNINGAISVRTALDRTNSMLSSKKINLENTDNARPNVTLNVQSPPNTVVTQKSHSMPGTRDVVMDIVLEIENSLAASVTRGGSALPRAIENRFGLNSAAGAY